jgi:hypothetical protein
MTSNQLSNPIPGPRSRRHEHGRHQGSFEGLACRQISCRNPSLGPADTLWCSAWCDKSEMPLRAQARHVITVDSVHQHHEASRHHGRTWSQNSGTVFRCWASVDTTTLGGIKVRLGFRDYQHVPPAASSCDLCFASVCSK